jgi:hypothetical protein
MWRRVFAMWGRCEKSVGAWLRVSGAGGLSFLCFCLFAGAASAQSDSPGSEVFTGLEASDNYASGYVGAGYALGKAGFTSRASGSARSALMDATTMTARSWTTARSCRRRSMARTPFSQPWSAISSGPGGSSSSCSPAFEAEAYRPPRSPQLRTRQRARIEAARGDLAHISPRLYLSADASYGTAFQEYCALARLGFRVRPRFSLGLEGGALGNEEYDAGRGGGFVRMNFRDTEFTLSGGLTGDYLEDEPSSYVALGVYRSF